MSSELVELIEQMAQGHQEALARLYDETAPVLNGLLLSILESPQDAEEVLLDVYATAWRNAASYSSKRGTVRAWLFTMARSAALDRIRQQRARPNTLALKFPGVSEPLAGEGSAERRSKIQTLLQELPSEQREVVMMAFFGGLTHSEIAGRLGQPEETIKNRIRMGMLTLRQRLEESQLL